MLEYVPSESEKIETLKRHLYYEVQMLGDATAMHYALVYPQHFSVGYTLPASTSFFRAINNMCLEAVPLHARGLIQFFTSQTRGRGGRDKDALARDFLRAGETWITPEIDETNYPNLKKVHDRADKEIAHLSYERVPADELQTKWDLAGITIEIFGLIESFVPKCKEDYVSNELTQNVINLADFVKKLKTSKEAGLIP